MGVPVAQNAQKLRVIWAKLVYRWSWASTLGWCMMKVGWCTDSQYTCWVFGSIR